MRNGLTTIGFQIQTEPLFTDLLQLKITYRWNYGERETQQE